jgi:hypothetical protein
LVLDFDRFLDFSDALYFMFDFFFWLWRNICLFFVWGV